MSGSKEEIAEELNKCHISSENNEEEEENDSFHDAVGDDRDDESDVSDSGDESHETRPGLTTEEVEVRKKDSSFKK